jgi:hypothetical protein
MLPLSLNLHCKNTQPKQQKGYYILTSCVQVFLLGSSFKSEVSERRRPWQLLVLAVGAQRERAYNKLPSEGT